MKVPFSNYFTRPPAPPGFGTGKVLPEGSAPLLYKLIFQWLTPFLEVGYSRPLEREDFWELPHARLTSTISDDVERNFYMRCPPEKRPRHMRDNAPAEPLTEVSTVIPSENAQRRTWFSSKPKPEFDESLFKAFHKTFFVRIWLGGILKLFSDTLKTTTPLVTKVLLTWLTESYVYSRATDAERAALGLPKPRGIAYGVGLAIALFVMQESASLMTNHYQQTALTTGLSVRTGIIGIVFRKSLRMSGKARVDHSVGQIATIISTDATRLDRFSAFAHNLWVSPIQIAIGIGLLLGNLGYSALVGLGVLLLGFPLQFLLVKVMYTQRKKGVKLTDRRVRLLTEVLQGIRLIKVYAWEDFYTQQIGDLRSREIRAIRKSAVARSVLIAVVTFIPVLASTLSFITYALSGHNLNIAIIFSSLQLFNIIRMPLVFFPFVFSALTDALVALGRIGGFLTSDDLPEPYPIDRSSDVAVEVDGDFVWETVFNPTEKGGKFGAHGAGRKGAAGGKQVAGGGAGGKKGDLGKEAKAGKEKPKGKSSHSGSESKNGKKQWWKRSSQKSSEKDAGNALPSSIGDLEKERDSSEKEHDDDEKKDESDGSKDEKKDEDRPFELKNLKFEVPKGSFVGIVGRVGCGKSSVLQALIGEMRRTSGEVKFGGSVSYAPQTPWIRNASLRENILFGQPDNEDRFREVISACCLDRDLEVLPQGEDTEIGEKGINLSGGQKARVSLARAAYSNSDIVLLDDPLSAVDAYVGKSILENCLLSGPLSNRTRILVTHALHVLDKTDYIYVMDNGVIIEQGTYQELMAQNNVFARLMDEYGSLEEEDEEKTASRRKKKDVQGAEDSVEEPGVKKTPAALMQTEERNTGAVTWDVYSKYLKFAGGVIWAPFILILLTLTQGAQVSNNLFLGFWTSNSIHGFKQGDYMAVYAALGVAQAVFQFILSFTFAVVSLIGSLNLFRAALRTVLRSPVSFFDTTPIGRILSRLSKDQDTLDTELGVTLMQFLSTFSSVVGTVALVFYTFPYLGIIFLPLSILYYIVAKYYRRSSVETKRLDSLMRSILYGSFTESLTGLATIRAYRDQDRSIKDAERGLDLENRAYYMTISIQRWLAIRLDFFGNILIFGIGLFAAGFRHSVNPAKIGVVLSYTLSITQIFSDTVAQFAQNEQNMNAVERVLHYTDLEQEAEQTTPNDPPTSWPSEGEIEFKNVELRYREGLPLVLKGISFRILAGEKVGIVGRTGAGKSSLLQALFRTVELNSGKIEVDGYNIREVGLNVLRSKLALVPQDGTLFLGTLRENIDPQGLRTDAELISALQRAWLLPKSGPVDPATEAKFSLDSVVGDEGANFSAGEKQLLALCRALVKNSKIIVLDEATSNVDVETDAKLQRTIQIEFASSTLLCIAHRLNTIAYYDRVIVMDDGGIAEFDTVLNLFDNEASIFRSLCDEANLQRADIVRIRTEHDIMLQS